MAAAVNVLKAQQVYLKLVECAMNQTYTNFNYIHGLIHGEEHLDSSEEEFNETVAVISYVAAMCRKLHQPRLTVLINSCAHSVGVGRGFYKDLGVKIDLAETHWGAFYCLMRGECYNYFADFCAHNEGLQQYVWDRIIDGLSLETVNGEFISQVVREQTERFAQASTSTEQISISRSNPLELGFVHREFFTRMRDWLDQACRYNDLGRLVWDMGFLTKAAKYLRREFTITVPLGTELNLYALTLAKELKEGQAYCATMDEVEMLTVSNMASGEPSIQHTPVENGTLVVSLIDDTRIKAGCATVSDTHINATAHPEKCTFKSAGGEGYTHVTLRVSFRLS